MSKTLNPEQVNMNYGQMMLKAILHWINTGNITENCVRTIKYVRENLYNIDPNPRYATLVLYLQYNLPLLEEHAHFIWDNLHVTEKYESQIKW